MLSLCAIALAFAAFADRKVTKLSETGWTLDGEPVSVPHIWNAVDGCDGGVNPPAQFAYTLVDDFLLGQTLAAR